jgi:hypothetical protein
MDSREAGLTKCDEPHSTWWCSTVEVNDHLTLKRMAAKNSYMTTHNIESGPNRPAFYIRRKGRKRKLQATVFDPSSVSLPAAHKKDSRRLASRLHPSARAIYLKKADTVYDEGRLDSIQKIAWTHPKTITSLLTTEW